MNTDPFLFVSEIFGPTIQGEGASQGRSVVFLRLGLCNLDCKWCDTPFTWDWTGKNGVAYDKLVELKRRTTTDIVNELVDKCAGVINRVVISGGEPMIQQNRLTLVIRALWAHGITCEIETNASLTPSDDMIDLANEGAVTFNCSPKLSNSGVDYENRIRDNALSIYADLPSTFKFVITNPDDIHEILPIIHRHQIAPHRIYLMPEGIETDTIQQQLANTMMIATEHGWSVSPRLHVLAYGNKRGI